MRPLVFTLKPCKLGGIVLTFQGFRADVSRPLFRLTASERGNY